MALLYQLVKTLTPAELHEIEMLPLQDREREVLALTIALNQKFYPSSTICKKLSIQPSHLDKINSILLKKTVEGLAGKNIFDQINYLNYKSGTWNISKRLLKNYELKVLEVQASALEKFQFYKFCHEWLLIIPEQQYSEAEISYYTGKMLQHCDRELYRETELWIRITLLRREINFSASHAIYHKPEEQDKIRKNIAELQEDATRLGLHRCAYRALLCGVIFHNTLKDFSESRNYLRAIDTLMEEKQEVFNDEDIKTMQWHYAQTLYFDNAFEESYAAYNTIFDTITKSMEVKWYMLFAEFFQVSLITGHYDTAKELCEQYFEKYSDDKSGSYYTSALIQRTKYDLFTSDYEAARNKLNLLYKSVTKTSVMQFQIALRELTVAYFYLTGKYDACALYAEKNLKYLRSKKIHQNIPEYTFHSRLAKSVIKFHTRNRHFDMDDMHMFADLMKGTLAQYGLLISKAYPVQVMA